MALSQIENKESPRKTVTVLSHLQPPLSPLPSWNKQKNSQKPPPTKNKTTTKQTKKEDKPYFPKQNIGQNQNTEEWHTLCSKLINYLLS